MKARAIAEAGLQFMAGLFLAWVASSLFIYAIEGQEMRNCSAGRPLFEQPIPRNVAQLIHQECQDKMQRDSVSERYSRAHSLPVVFLSHLIGFLLDPINLALTAIFSIFVRWLYRRFVARQPE